jgi:hypothetical protein
MNTARSGAKTYSGPVSYTTWIYAEVSGGGSVDTLMQNLGASGRLTGFTNPSITYIGVGILSVPSGLRIVVFGAAY